MKVPPERKLITLLCTVPLCAILLASCATQFGRDIRNASVRYTSKKPHLEYYLILLPENDRLKGGYRPLAKSKETEAFLSQRNPYVADGHEEEFNQSEYVLLVDCGQYYYRREVYLRKIVSGELSCER
jgi:hypothetical protein